MSDSTGEITHGTDPKLSRRRFIEAACGGAAALAMPDRTRAAEARRPNILLVNTDDWRWDCIGAFGNPNIRTPNIDALAARGMSFARTYTMGSMIGAVCLPSRTMMLTGHSLFRLPKQPGDSSLLPKVMSAAGYETYHIGKSGNEYGPAISAFDTNVVRNDNNEARRTSSEEHADAVIEYLRGRKGERPFFIYLAPPVPHDPRLAPEEFARLYDPEKLPLPPAYEPVHPFDNGEMEVRDEKLAPWPRTPEVVRRHLADYYSCITCFDHHLGRILACLREQGQLDNTIVIFTGDNGLSLGDHGLFGKQNVYELGGMHVPMIVAGPGIRQGKSDAMCYLMDLFPTICDLGGAPVPRDVEGKSLAPVLAGKATELRPWIYTAYKDVQRAIRVDRWKLIRYPQIDRTQLFDLQADPHERDDLSGKPEHAAKVGELMALLERAQAELADTCPLTVPNPRDPAWSPGKAEPAKAQPAKARRKKA